jgi:hypothetical protein
MVSEIAINGWFASLRKVCGRAEHHGGKAWESKIVHLMAARKQRKRKGLGAGHVPRAPPPVAYF